MGKLFISSVCAVFLAGGIGAIYGAIFPAPGWCCGGNLGPVLGAISASINSVVFLAPLLAILGWVFWWTIDLSIKGEPPDDRPASPRPRRPVPPLR